MLMVSVPCGRPALAFRAQRLPPRRLSICFAIARKFEHDVLVLGGGAAGLAAAYFAADSDASVTIIEKNTEPGKKILISGGTRCNILPLSVDLPTDFWSESSLSALRSVFARWSLEDCAAWLSDPQQVGISLALEAETSKLFPASNDAKEVRNKLLAACKRRGVTLQPSTSLLDLRQCEGGWECSVATLSSDKSATQGVLRAKRVVLATGGLSFPALGTTGVGYDILARLGHSLQPPYAALTPLLGSHPGGVQLPGLAVYNAELTIRAAAAGAGKVKKGKGGGSGGGGRRRKEVTSERTALLLTHRGFSGPAAMDLAHHFAMAQDRGLPPPTLTVCWIKEMDRGAWEAALSLTNAKKGAAAGVVVTSVLRRQGLPARLAEALCAEAGCPEGRLVAELRKEERASLLEALTCCPLNVTGTEGYPKAEVTGGGVPLNEIDTAGMESRLLPGLHLCGELVDVHGRIGGFNFFWAWCSGRLAGLGAAGKLNR